VTAISNFWIRSSEDHVRFSDSRLVIFALQAPRAGLLSPSPPSLSPFRTDGRAGIRGAPMTIASQAGTVLSHGDGRGNPGGGGRLSFTAS
jgi:hypothetical protein